MSSYKVVDNTLYVTVYVHEDIVWSSQKFNLNRTDEIVYALQLYWSNKSIVNILAHAVFNNLNFNTFDVVYCMKELIKIRKKTNPQFKLQSQQS